MFSLTEQGPLAMNFAFKPRPQDDSNFDQIKSLADVTIYEVRLLTLEEFRRQAESDNIGKIEGEQQKRQNLQPITSKSSALIRSSAFNHPSLPELEESKLASLSSRI